MKSFILSILILLSGSVFSQSADFTTSLTNNENCGGTIVTFTLNDTIGVFDYLWEFGNGQPDAFGIIGPGIDGTASTSYTVVGDFTVQLTVNGSISTVQTITIHALPTPDFKIINGTEETCINVSADVDFQYTGTVPQHGAAITEWNWNFGDGTGEHTQTSGGDVTYTYSSFGNYTVILDVTDLNGCTANTFKAGAVTLHSTPKANFSINQPTDCSLPITVDFSDLSTDDQSSITTYEWTFSEISTGTVIGTSTVQNPTFQFTNSGDYYATLKVTTSGGCVDEMTQTINLDANTVHFHADNQDLICVGKEVQFTNTSVDGSGGTPSSFHWDFGDGATSVAENPSHIYNQPNHAYSVTLQVVFSNGCVGAYTAIDLIHTADVPQSVIYVDKDEVCQSTVVMASTVPGALYYFWDFNYDGITPDFTSYGTSNHEAQLYAQEGVYRILMRAVNAYGCFEEAIYDSVVIKFPEANFDVTAGEDGCFILNANFDGGISVNTLPVGQNAITNYAWDFQNDGTIDQTGPSVTASHIYSTTGEFDVKLIITTETGCTDTIIKNQAVERGLPPVANFTFAQSDLCINTPVHFTNTSHPSILYPSILIDSLIWNFGDGTILSGNPIANPSLNIPTHIYTDDTQDDGVPYTVTLTVFTYGCNSSDHSEQLDIDYPVARFLPSQTADCQGGGQVIILEALDGNNLSEGVDQFRWDFGDGTFYPGPTATDFETGNDPTLNIIYSTTGHYFATLYVRNNTSVCDDIAIHEIIVETGTVDFETNDTIICRGVDKIQFTNLSVASEPGIEYAWDFGVDASPATYIGATPPPVTYSSNGEKTIRLTSNDLHTACGHTKIKSDYISVRGPEADFDWTSQNADNNVACINEIVAFTSTTNANANPNTNINFEWDFGSSSTPNAATRTNENPIDVSYGDFGKKTIWLEVTDNKGCVDKVQKDHIIIVPKLISDFDINASIYCTDYDISFTDNSEFLQNYDITSWAWDFGTDAVPAISTSQNPTNINYTTKGTKTVTLAVTNNKGCTDTYTKDFEMYTANASFTNITDAGCAPASVSFTNTSEDITSSIWDFGDPLSPSSSLENPSNIYIYPGEYEVTLITTSIGGCKDTLIKSADVFVDGSTFDSLSYVIDQPCLHSPANPEITYTIHGLTDTKYVVFDFGDGSPAYNFTVPNILNPPPTLDITHTYDVIGTFTPKLTLQDDPTVAGACGQFIYTPSIPPIVISDKPTALFSDNSALGEVCSGSQVDFIDESTNSDPSHTISFWAWEFGDTGSSTSTNQNPSFNYSDADIGNIDVKLTVTNSLGCFDDYTKSLTVVPGLGDATVATHDTVCNGNVVFLDGATPTGGDGAYVYLWKQSTNGSTWMPASGVNNQEDYTTTLVVPISTPITIEYKRKVSSATCDIVSEIFSITTDPSSVGGIISPNPITECFNDNQNTLTLTGDNFEIIEWQSDINSDFSTYTTIPNTTTTQTYTNLTDTTYYRVLVVSGVCPMVYSDTAIVNIKPEITGNKISPKDTLLCAMEDAGVISATLPQGGTGSFTFQWQHSNDNINFGNIVGETNPTYNPGGLMQTLYFRRVVISDASCEQISDTCIVNVIPQPDTTLMVSNPFVCEEDYATTPNTNIVVSNSEIGVNYQVFLVLDDSPQSSVFAGTGNDLDVSVVTPITTTNYYIIATPNTPNDAGVSCPVRLYNEATITIVPIPSDALSISDAIICEGQDASITISASEVDVKYYLKLAGVVKSYAQGDGNDITFIVSPGPTTTTTYEVWAVSTLNLEACDQIKLVDPAIITVLPIPDNSLIVSDPMVCGEDADFNITVSNTADTVTYTLVEQGGAVISSLTGTAGDLVFNLTTPPTSSVYEVWAKANSLSDYGVCDSVKLTDVANVTYAPTPDLTLAVSDDIICNGDGAVITITASENNVEYKLFPSGSIVLGNGSDVSFPAVTPMVTTTFNVYASSTIIASCVDVYLDDAAIITVIPTPSNLTVSTNPTPAEICSGNNFDITVEGTDNNVKYILQIGTTPTGDEFVGDGTNQTFTVNPIADVIYSVWATPTDLDQDGNECSAVQMGADVPVNVDGPITIDIQPTNAHVCTGLTATFGVEASNSSGDAIMYQWQEDSGSGFADMPGETSSNLTVVSPNTNSYQVIVGSVYCSSLTSNVVSVISGAAPVVDQLTITIDDLCLGNDVDVTYQSNLATNEYYRIFYNVTGNNTIADTSIVTLLTAGSGIFTMSADSFPNIGSNALIITEIDYAYGQGCSSAGLAITELFTIEEIPDTNLLSLSADNICVGNNEIVNVTSALSINNYRVTYNLTGANTATGLTATLYVSSTSGQFTILSPNISNIGTTNIIITEIANTWGQTCPVDGLNFTTSMEVEPMPDDNNLAVTIPNICSGNDAVANITGDLIDGSYQLSYTLSGANLSSNMVSVSLINGDGTVSFTIPQSQLVNSGTTNFELTDISFISGQNCALTGLSVQTLFDIELVPDVYGLDIYAPNICTGEDAIVYFTSNLPNGDYLVHYKINGDVPTYEEDITLSITTSDGNSQFTIDALHLPVDGFNTISLLYIENTFGNACQVGLQVSTPLTIEPLPDTTMFAMQVDTVCPSTDARVYITGNMIDGIYLLSYNLLGANAINGIPVVVNFANGDGTAEFSIPGVDLPNNGLTTISLQTANFLTGEQCGINNINIDADFMVEATPDVNSLAISAGNICVGNYAVIEVSSTLTDGNYIITYDVENANFHTDISDTLNIVSGNSYFTVDAVNLTNEGTTTIVITEIMAASGQQCAGAIATVVSGSFEIEPLPLIADANFIALDACQGDDVEIYGTSNLINGSYVVYYHITGVNAWPSDSVFIDITTGDGNFTYTIPTSVVPNFGASTIWIDRVRFNSGESCSINANYQSNFAIAKVPDVTNLVATTDDICLGTYVTVNLTSNLDDGSYIFTADITGVNPNADIEFTADITSGVGQLIIPADKLINVGLNTISIKNAMNKDGAHCASNVYNTASDFNINPIPNIDTLEMQIDNACLTYDAIVNVLGSLDDGLYIVEYDITGANTASSQIVNMLITAGQGLFHIPNSLLINTGAMDCIIRNISFTSGLSCNVDLNLSESFIVIPDPGTVGLTIMSDGNCVNTDAKINIESIFAQGEYEFTYNLVGINDTTNQTAIATFTDNTGDSYFTVPANLLTVGGEQTIVITGIDVIGVSCSSSGLSVTTDFNIEGDLEITMQPVEDTKCVGDAIDFEVNAKNNGGGNLYYQWYEYVHNDTIALNDQGVFDGTTSSKLQISDNTDLENTMYKCIVFTDHCPLVMSDSVVLKLLSGSACGKGLDNLPNAYSPNGDGVNDIWNIEGIQFFENNHVQVFTHMGGVIYEAFGYDNTTIRFDGKGNKGKSDNKEINDGTYFYTIDLGDGSDLLKGYLVINR